MIRPFDWRDMALMRMLRETRGVGLDSAVRLTRGSQPLQNALWGFLMPNREALTLVWRNNGDAAIGQVRHRPGEDQARAVFVSPDYASVPDGWAPLLEQMAVATGRRGAHHLIAEVDEVSREFEALRQSGFIVYARQSVWRLSQAEPGAPPSCTLRPVGRADAAAVSVLYANLVPRLVQQVEPPPRTPRGFALESNGEWLAYFDVRRGPLGIWIEPHLHPEAYDRSAELIRAALAALGPAAADGRPIYVCVRRYQDWLAASLAQLGFALTVSQAVMVKRLTVRLAEPAPLPLPAVEGQATTPIAQVRIDKYHLN